MKNITIYIRMIDGIEALVPVIANQATLESDSFLIQENPYLDLENDSTSIWEFFPGDVVECENIEGEIVAKSLIKSSLPNRELFELIFKIVSTQGSFDASDNETSPETLDSFFKNESIVQKKHPVVVKWIEENVD